MVGLAADALEKHCGSTGFMPTRLTVDLFRAARCVPTAVSVRVVRDGRRVRSAECDVAQEDRLVARATLLQYRRSTAPPGRLWTPPMSFPFPPPFQEGVQTAVHSDAAQWSHSGSGSVCRPIRIGQQTEWRSGRRRSSTAPALRDTGMTTAGANPRAQIDFATDPFPLKIP